MVGKTEICINRYLGGLGKGLFLVTLVWSWLKTSVFNHW
jgi:hypothetical protein